MSQRYIGGLETLNPTPLNPALGNAANGIFSMSQYFSLKNQGLWPAIDPYFRNTTLLLHGNGTNGAQNNTFLDSSTNNFTITRNGNTTQGTFTPYGSNWSNNFTASSGDCLVNTSSALASTTASTFTAEAWVFLTATPSNASFPSMGTVITLDGAKASANIYMSFGVTTSNTISLYWYDGSSKACIGSTALTLNQWTHIAASVNSNTIKLFVNGVSETLSGTTTLTNRASATNTFAVGGNYYSTTPAYISNARVTNTAVYTSNFTPSTTPLTAISGTQLLTCQSNRFIDNSSNAFAITVNGSPSVQRFSPFNPTTPYAAGTIGGSGYFDGNGDSLQTPSNAAFTFGTGDFTLECWAYLSGNYPSVVSGIVDISTSNSTGRLVLDLYSTGYVNIETVGVSLVASNTLLPKNAWSHLVAVRSGTTLSLFQNGTRVGTATNSTNFSFSQAYVGVTSDGYYWSGYLSSVRLVKGTAVYDPSQSTLTVPTAPLTNISNTSLLLNFTNGGIIDNAMMMNGETVGTAEISTSVVKYGTGSISTPGSTGVKFRPNGTNGADAMFGTGDFTIECWVYITQNTANAYPIGCTQDPYVSDNTSINWMLATNQGSGGAKLNLLLNNNQSGITIITGTSTLSNNTWIHLAATRSSGTVRLFVNGNLETTTANTNNVNTPSSFVFANWGPVGGNRFAGYIDDLRITKGYARYTANFTPQTSQWQDQ